MQKCKVKSFKSIGLDKTYNVTMRGNQHNYFIENGGRAIATANSHSAAYAFIAYQTAYLKVYYPIEFMASLLSSEIGNEDKMKIYLVETKRMGIEIRPANINKSSDSYKIERGRLSNGKEGYFLRTPLTSIAGIGDKAVSSILAAQPFSSFKDFLAKIDARQVNKKVFASLVGEGCMDDIWGLARPEMISKYEEVKKAADKEKKSKKKQIEHEGSMGGSIFDMDTGSIQI